MSVLCSITINKDKDTKENNKRKIKSLGKTLNWKHKKLEETQKIQIRSSPQKPLFKFG